MTETGFIIVGGGLAGAKAAEALRDQGYDGRLTLVGAERHLPYERPPLSKGYLAGTSPREEMDVHDAEWYAERQITLLLGSSVVELNPERHTVTLETARSLRYDKLLLATGSRPRTLSLPGIGAEGVQTLRTVDDSDRIAAAVRARRPIAIIGGGWIGMEVAAGAALGGCTVTVVEAAPLPLLGVLGPEIARVFLGLHRQHSVEFHLGAEVAEITTSNERATGVRLGDGTTVPAELVLVGVGAVPNIELAATAGLQVDDGVLVDEALQTSDPDIVAVGDIANQQHPVLLRRVRVEHWANALNQPAAAAATMLGRPTPYTELPYFFTDQYDLGMEYVGHAPPTSYARVVTRGDVEAREFLAFWLGADGQVMAAMSVNLWDVVNDLKALILSGTSMDDGALADPDVPLSRLAAD